MFCNQCEQTAKGIGCSVIGVCGKNEEVADLQDLLVYALQGLALYAQEGRRLGIVDDATDHFTYEAIFSTLTNVDFDPDRFLVLLQRTVELREAMKAKVAAAGGNTAFSEPQASFIPAGSVPSWTHRARR
jgi:hydroxylamine reductase